MKIRDFVANEIDIEKEGLYLVAGRPSIGTTAFSLSAALDLAMMNNTRVAYFSIEMSKDALRRRAEMMNRGADDSGSRMPIDVFEETSDIEDIGRICTEKGDYDIVFVDRLQLVSDGEKSSADSLRDLKKMAVVLGCPVIVVSWLSNSVESGKDYKPRLDKLSSDGLNLDLFDQVFLLYRPYYYFLESDETLFIVKTKDAEVSLAWDAQRSSVL